MVSHFLQQQNEDFGSAWRLADLRYLSSAIYTLFMRILLSRK